MSAFTSALSGGLMMAQAVYGFCAHRRMKFIPENHADSSLDEYLSYAFAALGFYFQVRRNLNIALDLALHLVRIMSLQRLTTFGLRNVFMLVPK